METVFLECLQVQYYVRCFHAYFFILCLGTLKYHFQKDKRKTNCSGPRGPEFRFITRFSSLVSPAAWKLNREKYSGWFGWFFFFFLPCLLTFRNCVAGPHEIKEHPIKMRQLVHSSSGPHSLGVIKYHHSVCSFYVPINFCWEQIIRKALQGFLEPKYFTFVLFLSLLVLPKEIIVPDFQVELLTRPGSEDTDGSKDDSQGFSSSKFLPRAYFVLRMVVNMYYLLSVFFTRVHPSNILCA